MKIHLTQIVLSVSVLALGVYALVAQVRLIYAKKQIQTLQMQVLKTEVFYLQQERKLIEKAQPFEEVEVVATAYCPCRRCCGEFSDGITATGTDAYTRGVAVDPNFIPLGSIIEIPGYGKVIADDVGGAIKGRKIDVRFQTHQEALEWGRQKIRIRFFRKSQK